MKDFDAPRNARPRRSVEDRTFQIGGQVLVIRDRFRPEVLEPLDKVEDPITDKTTCRCEHRPHQHNEGGVVGACQEFGCDCEKFTPKVLSPGSPMNVTLAAIDETITGLLDTDNDPTAADRYKAVRESTGDPLEIEDMMEIIQWATEKDTGHPTGPPTVSTAGLVQTGPPSTADSLSPVPVTG